MPDAAINRTPAGWPFLDDQNYIDVIDDYTLDLAQKLESTGLVPTSEVTDTGWISITPNAGFTADAAYRRINGIVYFRGTMSRIAGNFTTAREQIATIPAGFRPTADARGVTGARYSTAGTFLVLEVVATGGVYAGQGGVTSTSVVYMSTIMPYPAAA